MNSQIRFSVVKFKPGWYWSKVSNKMFWSDDIGNIVWESEGIPVKTDIMDFDTAIEFIKNNPGDCKSHRNALVRIIANRFPLKDMVGIENWDGVIYCDLDMHNSLLFDKLDSNKRELLFNQLDYALQNLAPNNYFYIEHSSNDDGIHAMFYFECERNQFNHDRFCKWIYDIFRYKIDEYIKDFSKVVFEETNGHAVFDSVYERPYQKLYITTKDMIAHQVDGYCDDIDVDFVEKEIEEDKINGSLDVKFITSKRKYDTDYYDRLYVLTALKKYVGDKEEARKLWNQFCEQISLYKNYTVQKFKNMFDQNWDKVKAESGHISILKKYGFNVDENKLYIHLNENEYLGDYASEIINFCTYGINLVIAPTGSGKTEGWKGLNAKYSEVLEFQFHRPILIVEPMNSIIESKYDDKDFFIVKGSKSISNLDLSSYKCVVTNYNHLIRRDIENGFRLIDDIDSFFNKFELVIIDESHILMKDMFRSEVLIPFMQTLNKVTSTKIIIQTATELFESSVLDIKKRVIISKEEKRNIKVIYRQVTEDKFNISSIVCLTNYYISNGKKVYIYWKNGSLQNMKFLKNIFPDSIIVYHKRDIGSEQMSQINSEHILGECDVMISSVYFGVGNDLNDNVDDAAVIIIGNNIWQEDVQAIGRWRNAKNIEVCVVLLPFDKDIIEASKESPFDYGTMLSSKVYMYDSILKDKYNKNKDITISGKAFKIKDESYINYLANMDVANAYSEQFCVKNKEFRKLGYDVRETIKPLLSNDEWIEALKEHRKNLKNVRNNIFKDCLSGKYDWSVINKDSVTERCAKIIKKMNMYNLFKYCDMKKFTKNNILNYGVFLKYYSKISAGNADYAEIFSILFSRKMINSHEDKEYSLGDIKVSAENYYIACGYLIWTYYREKDCKSKENINSFYLKDFIVTVKAFCSFSDGLVGRLFTKVVYDDNYNSFIEEFLGSKIEKDTEINEENIFDYIIKLDYDSTHLAKTSKRVIEYFKDRKTKGKVGGKNGSPKKKCIITDKFKHPEKYNLVIGQEFESSTSLAEYTKKRVETISLWRKKEWIK